MDDQDVAFHDVGHMVDHQVINLNLEILSLFLYCVFLLFSDPQVEIVVLGQVEVSVPDVVVCTRVAGVGNVFWVVRVALVLSSVINRTRNDIPSYVPIAEFTLYNWSAGCKS